MVKRLFCIAVLLLGLEAAGIAQAPSGWQVASQHEFSLEVVQGIPHSLSPDGSWLLSIGQEQGLCLYSTQGLALQGCYKLQSEPDSDFWLSERSISWAPDGEQLAFSTLDEQLWLLSPQEGLRQLPTAVEESYDTAWSPDGEYLAVGGGGTIVVVSPGSLAEAPAACYEGMLAGLRWADRGDLVYGLRTPDGKGFQIWQVAADGARFPQLVWSYPHEGLRLIALSPGGRFAWVGAALVDLEQGEHVLVRERNVVTSLVFSPEGGWWLYAYRKLEGLDFHHILALRPAGAAEGEEQLLFEDPTREMAILGWSRSNLVGFWFPVSDAPVVVLLQLAPRR